MFCYKDIKQFLSNITPFERISIHVHVSSKLASTNIGKYTHTVKTQFIFQE